MRASEWVGIAVASCAGSTLASAQSFSSYYVDVGAPGSIPSSAYGGAAGAPGVWNGFNAASPGPAPMLTTTGASSPVSLQISGGGGNFSFDNAATFGDDQALMDDTGDLNVPGSGLDTAVYTFQGLTNGRYRVYVYAWTPDFPGFTTDVRPSGGQPCTEACGGANWSGVHVEGQTYLVQEISVSTGALTIAAASNSGRGSVNGIQIVPLGTTLGAVTAIDIEPPPSVGQYCTPSDPNHVARGLVVRFGYLWVSYEATSSKCIAQFETPSTPPTGAPKFVDKLAAFDATHAGPMGARVIINRPQLLIRQPADPVAFLGTYEYSSSGGAHGVVSCASTRSLADGGGHVYRGVGTSPLVPGWYWEVTDSGELKKYYVPPTVDAVTLLSSAPYPFANCYGLAYDAVNDLMWAFTRSNDCGLLDHQVEFRAFSPSTGVATGQRFMGAVNLPAPNRALACAATERNGNLAIVALHECAGGNRLVVYDLGVPFPSGPVSYCAAGTSTNGCNAAMGATGNPSATLAHPCFVSATNVEGLKQGLIFYGVSGQAASPWGASFLCVKAPSQRTGPQNSGGSFGSCDGALVLDWNAFVASHPSALGAPFSAGQVLNAQGWFRDPPTPKSSSLSDGLELTLLP